MSGPAFELFRRRIARRSRVPRAVVFALGVLAGGVAVVLPVQKEAPPARANWNTEELVFVGQEGNRSFVRNQTGRDIRLDPAQVLVLARAKHGLVTTEARLLAPVFLPAGEAVGVELTETLPAAVLFDPAARVRVDLEGRRDD